MKINKKNTTFVSGFWHIPKNKKRNLQHYKSLLSRTMEMVKGQNLIYYHNGFELNGIGDNVIQRNIEVENLPTYDISSKYLNSCKAQNNNIVSPFEKGGIHYRREYMESGEESFRKVFTVWTSKLFLLKEVYNENPFDTEYFSWIDASISRMNYQRKNWDFMNKIYPDDECAMIYKSSMSYKRESLKLSCGFMLFDIKSMKDIINLYEEMLEALSNDNYAHDEETILHEVEKANKVFSFMENI